VSGVGIGCDIVALGERELARLRAERRRFADEIDRGLLLASRAERGIARPEP
jgi:hypothetical protein